MLRIFVAGGLTAGLLLAPIAGAGEAQLVRRSDGSILVRLGGTDLGAVKGKLH